MDFVRSGRCGLMKSHITGRRWWFGWIWQVFSIFFKCFSLESVFSLTMNHQTPTLGLRRNLLSLVSGALVGSSFGNWDAAPLDVHEWGVNTFDWNLGEALEQELPDYLYEVRVTFSRVGWDKVKVWKVKYARPIRRRIARDMRLSLIHI